MAMGTGQPGGLLPWSRRDTVQSLQTPLRLPPAQGSGCPQPGQQHPALYAPLDFPARPPKLITACKELTLLDKEFFKPKKTDDIRKLIVNFT